MKITEKVSWLMSRVQESLLPHLNTCLPAPLTEQEEHLVSILEIVEIERHLPRNIRSYRNAGRKPLDREAMARAFIAKIVYRHPTTSDLRCALQSSINLCRICGFAGPNSIPSESTFSRVFAEFAVADIGSRTLNALVKDYLSDELVGHVSRDSTAITGREAPAKKVEKKAKKSGKRGRPAKGEQRGSVVEKRIDRQVGQSIEEALRELPSACDRGVKKNAKGYTTAWNGYKLHLDTNDTCLPISAFVTSASVHDSQVAIPLMKSTSQKVIYLYDLMDAAYHAETIEKVSRDLGHVPIIDKNKRKGGVIPMAPHEAQRYKIRSVAERANSRLKEDFGANNVMVKGHSKVTLHLMTGVIALFADQLIRLLT